MKKLITSVLLICLSLTLTAQEKKSIVLGTTLNEAKLILKDYEMEYDGEHTIITKKGGDYEDTVYFFNDDEICEIALDFVPMGVLKDLLKLLNEKFIKVNETVFLFIRDSEIFTYYIKIDDKVEGYFLLYVTNRNVFK